jgi:hypothetical protein
MEREDLFATRGGFLGATMSENVVGSGLWLVPVRPPLLFAPVCGNVNVGICRADTRVDSGRGNQNNFEQLGRGNNYT